MKYPIILSLVYLSSFFPVQAWSNHGLGTWVAFSQTPEVASAPFIPVESLESFLEKEKLGIQKVLLENENTFCLKMNGIYPPISDSLRFQVQSKDLRKSFLSALRVNPNTRLGYYIQEIPGNHLTVSTDSKKNSKSLSFPAFQKFPKYPQSLITTYKDYSFLDSFLFRATPPGTKLSPLQILSTASDEPDYGMDVGLFEDNGMEVGKVYGFGLQPFGDPKYEYSAQAPFHMGFYHEGKLIYTLASFLEKTFPEYRAYQYFRLSQLAFRTGHPYWGYRFAGWGMHYIQDLTQPYHAKVLPQYSTFRLIGINLLAILGFGSAKTNAVERVSSRHSHIERYQLALVWWEMESRVDYNTDSILLHYLPQEKNESTPLEIFNFPREIVSQESYDLADTLDQRIEEFPQIFQLDEKKPDLKSLPLNSERNELDGLLQHFARSFGRNSRISLQWILAK
jgi:hypothetical protein